MKNKIQTLLPIALLVLCLTGSAFKSNPSNSSMAQLPDLKVMGISVEGNSPCYGELNKVKVTIFNAGLATSKPGVPISLRIDPVGATYREIMKLTLPPNTFKTVTFKRVKNRPGDNRITAIVNPGKKMQETSYTNNGKTISVKATIDCDAVIVE